jgi:hypothetical protein
MKKFCWTEVSKIKKVKVKDVAIWQQNKIVIALLGTVNGKIT